MWRYKTPGIPDEMFLRDDRVPITKEEVRAITISKARLEDGFTVIDIGSGSGSITIEAALIVGKEGKVYAIDKDENAIELTKANVKRFNLSNVEIIHDAAQNILDDLPRADAIFIGGTGGDTYKIIKHAYDKLKNGRRLVIDTILLESIYHAIMALQELTTKELDIVQVTISKSKSVSMGTMLLARNPVTIISVEK